MLVSNIGSLSELITACKLSLCLCGNNQRQNKQSEVRVQHRFPDSISLRNCESKSYGNKKMLRDPIEPRSIHKPPTAFCISTQKAEYMALSKRLDTQK
jgi:hypothetical protein